jgi:transcriptional regulator with XRE-family HTH domain
MGLKTRIKCEKLPKKLKAIREKLGYSQNEMLRALGYEEMFDRSSISHYESGEREPPLPVLLNYARAAGLTMEVLVDDNLNLPE